jgi:hypothetical protein
LTNSRLAWEYPGAVEGRKDPRFPVGLPAILSLGHQNHSARVIDVSSSGAMIETAVRFTTGSPVYLRCGTIVARGIVAWIRIGRIGLKFDSPLSQSELEEQNSRSGAIACRRLEFPR